ncbi:MAG: ribbon-helix-helix protein, CopG family [Armatimonadota bacterium]|nr:ribbon-helix-helix protein, CopG family [Armatimonadota bacterium]
MATATKQSTTVRISEKMHHSLRDLAEQSGESMQAILERALEQYRRQRFLEDCQAAYANLQQDPEQWASYQKEVSTWDAALLDGLDAEEAWAAERLSAGQGEAHG